jgi:hypothetical protein
MIAIDTNLLVFNHRRSRKDLLSGMIARQDSQLVIDLDTRMHCYCADRGIGDK